MKNIAKTRLFYCLIFLFLVFAQSCKRELFEPSQTKAQATSKIQDIKYSEFFDAVNSSGMGDLKQLLAPANQGGNGQKLMSTNIAERQFRIDMNAVKKLVLGDTVSYVVSLMPSSAHTVHFQNLTVQKIKDRTTAFLATYTPSKEWIADWKNGRHLAFSGTVSFSRIDPKLINENAGTAANIEPASNQTTIGAGNGKVSSVATANKISLAPGECEIFDIYSIAAHQCSTGDWPGSCLWERDGLTDNDKKNGAYLPYYSIQMTTVVNCAPPDMPPAPGGGGGGATTPTPPSDYDPCPGGAGAIAYANVYGGLKLAVAAGNPCDGGETGLTPIPTNPAAATIQSLIANLPITDYAQQQYLYNNTNVAVAVYNYLITNGWTPNNKGFANWALGYLVGNTNVDINVFIKNFLTGIETTDSYTDDNGWYQNTSQQQQQLPSKLTYYANYPKREENGRIYGLSSSEVYTMVGGSLDIKNKAGNPNYQNACAIRASRALNYAGVTIPVVVYNNSKKTEQGGDGKNYILSATAFQKFMFETFGNATYKLTSQQIGNDKSKIVDFLKGKTGIFIVTNMYPGAAGYSGHVDYIINGACINGANINPKGGIEKIEVWELN